LERALGVSTTTSSVPLGKFLPLAIEAPGVRQEYCGSGRGHSNAKPLKISIPPAGGGLWKSRLRGGLLYAAVLAGVVLLCNLAIRTGTTTRRGGPAVGAAHPTSPGGAIPTWHLLAAIGGIVVLCRAGGWLARQVGEPSVVGEIVAGVLLGPSLLGAIAPSLVTDLLPPSLQVQLGALANVGVVLFVFGLGLELDGRALRNRSHAAIWVSHASIAVPFVGGCFLALVLPSRLGAPGSFGPYCLFIGAAMSITAFPVLGRILDELELRHTPLGHLSIVCAAVDDVTAWIALTVVVAMARSSGAASTVRTILFGAVLVAVMLIPVRRLLSSLVDHSGMSSLALVVAIALLTAAVSDLIGLHAIFGAFLAGCAIPRRGNLKERARGLAPLTESVLLPLFFVMAGLQADLRGLLSHPGELVAGLAILAVAVAGKLGGAWVAARRTGSPQSEALALGVLMNTRGLTELVILNVGLQLGVLPSPLYTLLVLMALITTIMTAPLLRLLRTGEHRLPRQGYRPPTSL
jgi:Kef-type K+ transport system membrane component KefB